MYLRDILDNHLRNTLSLKRYTHCLGVEKAALKIARRFGLPEKQCSLAGLAHDICREMNPAQLEDLTGRKHENPVLLHGEAGAILLEWRFGVTDRFVLSAVTHHISGYPGLDKIGMAVFAADFLEEGRSHLDGKERERLFTLDLDDMVLEIALSIKHHLEENQQIVEPAMNEMIEVLS